MFKKFFKQFAAALMASIIFGGITPVSVLAATVAINNAKAESVTHNSATITGFVSYDSSAVENVRVWVDGSSDPQTLSGDSFSIQLSGLLPDRDYNITVCVKYQEIGGSGSDINDSNNYARVDFKTGKEPVVYTLPSVVTNSAAYSSSDRKINVTCTLTDNGGDSNTEIGFVYSSSDSIPTLTSCEGKVRLGTPSVGTGMSNNVSISSTDVGNTYYVRAYATNSFDTGYGEKITVSTAAAATKPTVSTQTCTITGITASLNGKVSDIGSSALTERGFAYSTSNTTPDLENSTSGWNKINGTPAVTSSNATTAYSGSQGGLSPSTTYYICAYARNGAGYGYGNKVTLSTATVPTVTTQSCTMSGTTATLNGKVTNVGNGTLLKRGFIYSTTDTTPDAERTSVWTTVPDNTLTASNATNDYSAPKTGLSSSTVYYVYAYAQNEAGYGYGTKATLNDGTKPTVVTTSASLISSNSNIIAYGEITNNGSSSVTDKGFEYSTDSSFNNKSTQKVSSSDFSYTLSVSSSNQTYYVRAYATNSAGTAVGSYIKVSTRSPLVSYDSRSNITSSSAGITINVTSTNSSSITERGVVYSKGNKVPVIGQSGTGKQLISSAGSSTGKHTASLTGLERYTTYYFRAYAINSNGTSYSDVNTFTTNNDEGSKPTVETTSASVSGTTLSVAGKVTNYGSSSITSVWFEYSTSSSFTSSTIRTESASLTSSDTFSRSISVSSNTTYYVRACATNSAGQTGYGSTLTAAAGAPSVRIDSVSNVYSTSADVKMSITSIGSANVSDRGVVYCKRSYSTSPTASSSSFSKKNTTGTISSTRSDTFTITGLERNTEYAVRAYATNSKGTTYSATDYFTTNDNYGDIRAIEVTNVQSTSATFKGRLDVSSGVTENGVVYSTSSKPTTSNSKIKNSKNTTGDFSLSMTGLSSNTYYYARAYMIKSGTTYYSDDTLSFRTLDSSTATVQTTGTSNIKANSATVSGSITNNSSSSIYEKGFVYSNSVQQPTISNSKVTSSSTSSGSYSESLTGLSPSTTYYVRAYARLGSSSNITYGSVLSFKTLSNNTNVTVTISYIDTATGKTVKTQQITAATGTTLNRNNLQLPSGYALENSNWTSAISSTLTIRVNVKKLESAYMLGVGDKFYPERPTTRAEVAKAIYALAADKTIANPGTFTDVPANHEAIEAIRFCSSNGYMIGYEDRAGVFSFRPERNISRAEIATVLCKVYNFTGTASSDYIDLPSTHWAYGWVSIATQNAMISGYLEDHSFRPENPTKRVEVCSMLSNAEKRSSNPLGSKDFSDVPKTYWGYNYIMNAAIAY